MTAWVRVPPAAGRGGDVGGDAQVGDSWCAQWRRPLPDDLWALVTRYFYPAVPYLSESVEPEYMEMQTEYLVCRDPADPGGTELNSEGVYTPGWSQRTDDVSVQQAAEQAQAPDDAEWYRFAPAGFREVA